LKGLVEGTSPCAHVSFDPQCGIDVFVEVQIHQMFDKMNALCLHVCGRLDIYPNHMANQGKGSGRRIYLARRSKIMEDKKRK